MREYSSYEDFGAYHAAQLTQHDRDANEDSFAQDVLTAFLGFGLIMFAIWQTVGF